MEKKASLNIIAAAALWGCIGLFLKLLTAAGLALVPLALDFVAVLTVGGRGSPADDLRLCAGLPVGAQISELLAESLVRAGRPPGAECSERVWC